MRYYIRKGKFSLEYRRTDIFTIAVIQYLEFGIKNVIKKHNFSQNLDIFLEIWHIKAVFA